MLCKKNRAKARQEVQRFQIHTHHPCYCCHLHLLHCYAISYLNMVVCCLLRRIEGTNTTPIEVDLDLPADLSGTSEVTVVSDTE